MTNKLDEDMLNLTGKDLDAMISHAVERVRAGRWSADVADMMAHQVLIFHGEKGSEKLFARVERELERRPAL